MNTTLKQDYEAFAQCADEAPEGCYESAKALHALISATMASLMESVRSHGLQVDTCDRAFELEAAIYGYVRSSNPDATVFPTAEGFGRSLNGPARERVLENAIAGRNLLRRASGAQGS